MILGYLSAQYPKTSHTFVRREIAALERRGFSVRRYATRRIDETLVDPADVAEREVTRVLLDAGPVGLLGPTVLLALLRPGRWVRTLARAVRMGRRSDRGLLVHLGYFAEACVLVRWMRKEGVEHLHAHFATNATSIALLARELGGPPYSFTVHGPHDIAAAPLLSFDQKVREAAFVAAVSHHTRAQLLRFCDPADWDRIHIVRCGLDALFLAGEPERAASSPRFVCVARFDREKGHLVLLEATARLVREGRPVVVELIGDGPLRAEIERTVSRLGLGKHVVLHGWLQGTAVRDRLVACRALVLPSFAEGLPVVLMEALAMGRPAISTYVAGIPELVVDGENGWLVPASSVEALADAMRSALALPDAELAEMGARGRVRARAQHDVDVEAGKLAELFRGERAPSAAPDGRAAIAATPPAKLASRG